VVGADRVTLFFIFLILIATSLFVAHRRRWISNRTFAGLVGVAAVIAMFAAVGVFYMPAASQPTVQPAFVEHKIETPPAPVLQPTSLTATEDEHTIDISGDNNRVRLEYSKNATANKSDISGNGQKHTIFLNDENKIVLGLSGS
jgi:hypothetical protein